MIYTYKQKKSWRPVGAAFVAVIALVGVGYVGSQHLPAPSSVASVVDSDLSVENGSTAPGTPNSQLLSVVAEINSLNLKGGIFNDQAFNSFMTFATPTLQPAGRIDPFAPLIGTSATTSNPFR